MESDHKIESELIKLSHKFAEDPQAFFFYASAKVLGITEHECIVRFRSACGIK